MRRVLVVTSRASLGDETGAALEAAGFDVLQCPGPRAPGYRCLGGEGRRCPLAACAQAVVLDDDLDSDDAINGTSSSRLLGYYTTLGLPVILLAGAMPGAVAEHDAAATLSRYASADEIVRAVERVLDPSSAVPEGAPDRCEPGT